MISFFTRNFRHQKKKKKKAYVGHILGSSSRPFGWSKCTCYTFELTQPEGWWVLICLRPLLFRWEGGIHLSLSGRLPDWVYCMYKTKLECSSNLTWDPPKVSWGPVLWRDSYPAEGDWGRFLVTRQVMYFSSMRKEKKTYFGILYHRLHLLTKNGVLNVWGSCFYGSFLKYVSSPLWVGG